MYPLITPLVCSARGALQDIDRVCEFREVPSTFKGGLLGAGKKYKLMLFIYNLFMSYHPHW